MSRDLLEKLECRPIFVLPADRLPELLESADTVREEDTGIAGPIRILRIEGRVAIQEQIPDTRDVVVRGFPTQAEAESFVEERLRAYERMWDGCGCRIDYFSVTEMSYPAARLVSGAIIPR